MSGTATDLNTQDTQPAVCVFSMTYADGSFEFYRGTQGQFGPYTFQKFDDPSELKVQPCTQEWTGMDECDGYLEPPIWFS